jgi:hypothetical protein
MNVSSAQEIDPAKLRTMVVLQDVNGLHSCRRSSRRLAAMQLTKTSHSASRSILASHVAFRCGQVRCLLRQLRFLRSFNKPSRPCENHRVLQNAKRPNLYSSVDLKVIVVDIQNQRHKKEDELRFQPIVCVWSGLE